MGGDCPCEVFDKANLLGLTPLKPLRMHMIQVVLYIIKTTWKVYSSRHCIFKVKKIVKVKKQINK